MRHGAPDARGRESGTRLRAGVIINPYSSGMTAKRELAIVRTLREHMDLEVRRTERGGHAPKLAQELLEAGDLDVIIACGGDGTANEVLNGMELADDTAAARPRVAILPSGGTNVVARALGYVNHPVRATKQLVTGILEGHTRTINLATMDERTFLFAAGVGLDGEVVKRMEMRRTGRRPSDTAHVAALVGIYASSRFALGDRMTIRVTDTGEELRAAMLMVGNSTPLTYVGRMPLHLMPDCTFEGGLDFIAPHRANVALVLRNASAALGMARRATAAKRDEASQLHHDVRRFVVECDDPQPVQVDGEYAGDRTRIEFGLVERAVRLVVPTPA